MTAQLDKAIRACIGNAERLLDETYDLEIRQPEATRFVIAVIAQEEIAKGFLLHLVKIGAVPMTNALHRAMKDHACKHLVGMIIDYLAAEWETIEQLQEMIRQDYDLGNRFPDDIGSALEILRYEKIGRWTKNNWIWSEDPNYDQLALKVARGSKDRRKQQALYVGIGPDGQVVSDPVSITSEETSAELEIAGRYLHFIRAVIGEREGGFSRSRYDKLVEALKVLFHPSND